MLRRYQPSYKTTSFKFNQYMNKLVSAILQSLSKVITGHSSSVGDWKAISGFNLTLHRCHQWCRHHHFLFCLAPSLSLTYTQICMKGRELLDTKEAQELLFF
ncbi:UNVERIFIED_CONTAM: hypothetical protein K2H54_038907 [Gekko kuhli]